MSVGSSPGPAVSKSGPPVRYGITPPLSLQEPSEADLALSKKMIDELDAEFPNETSDGMKRREAVLQELEHIMTEWITEVGMSAGMPQQEAKQSTVKIVTLGSYRLGVVQPGSDIDTLCIGPPHVSREAFFSTCVEKLERQDSVTDCVPIPDAFTPIIKLKMRGVSIDLLFARLVRPLAEGKDPEEAAKDDDVLRDMDDKSVRCINGFRVADQILQLVPNKETFRQALRFVKCWAKRRGIYSNVLGFFGGITWALLVARVCQLHPYYAPSQLVNRFFRLYDQWNWSRPVMLCDIVEPQSVPGMSSVKVWNPKTNPADKQHIMPVITPVFPAMNSTHNVTETTKRVLLDEFRRGYEVVKSVEAQKSAWKDVLDPFPFFSHFRNFLWVEVLAKTDEVYVKFSGWVESKLRILTRSLEAINGMIIHPNPEQYDLKNMDTDWPLGCGMFIAMSFFQDQGAFAGQVVDMRPALHQFVDVISQWTEKDTYSGQHKLRLRQVKRQRLPEYVTHAETKRARVSKE